MVISITNQKGGVGKTTTAISLARGLFLEGFKTLIIDNDPQCNATDTYNAEINNVATVYDIMKEKASINEAIQSTNYGDIIACDPLLKTADNEFLDAGRAFLLKETIDEIKKDYDYIIIDTNPSLGILMVNAITASDSLIIPVMTGRYSLQSLSPLKESIISAKKYTNPNINILGILVTLSQDNTKIMKDLMENFKEIENIFDTKLFKTSIRATVKVREAESNRMPVLDFAPYCTASLDYKKLVKEVLERLTMELSKRV